MELILTCLSSYSSVKAICFTPGNWRIYIKKNLINWSNVWRDKCTVALSILFMIKIYRKIWLSWKRKLSIKKVSTLHLLTIILIEIFINKMMYPLWNVYVGNPPWNNIWQTILQRTSVPAFILIKQRKELKRFNPDSSTEKKYQ